MNRLHDYPERCIGCRLYLETILAPVPGTAGHALRVLISSQVMNQETRLAACAE
jgi:hypothetical protein